MKGQAAMEFLMTYGWALLIILVAIGVLATFGVFSGKGVGEACLLGPGLACTSKIVDSQENPDISERIEMMIVNGFGKGLDEFIVTINPRGQRCHGVTGYVVSGKLSQFYPTLLDVDGQPIKANFPDGATLSLRSPGHLSGNPQSPITPGHYGVDCTPDRANCCLGYNGFLSILPYLPVYTISCDVPSPPAPGQCVSGARNDPDRLPRAGGRFKEDLVITYRFGDSSLMHSRVGTLMGIVEIQ